MLLTQDRLQRMAPGLTPGMAAALAGAIDAALPMYQADQPLICAHFVGQTCYETSGFLRFEENLNYLDPARIAGASVTLSHHFHYFE